MAIPGSNFPGGMPGEPAPTIPNAGYGRPQATVSGPKIRQIKVKAGKTHMRTIVQKPKPSKPAQTGGTPANPDQALINAAVRSQFAPQEQSLHDRLIGNTRFTSGLGDWYTNAMNEIRGLQAQGQQAAQGTLGQVTAYNSQPTLQNPNDQQAAQARNSLQTEFAGRVGSDASASSDAMARLAAALLIQQGNTRNQANAERQGLLGQQGALGQQKADYGMKYGAQLSQAEQTAATKQQANEIAAKALGVKVKTLNQVQIPLAKSLNQDRVAGQKVARTNARTQRVRARNQKMESDRQFQLDQKKFGSAQAKDNYQKSHGLGPYKPPSGRGSNAANGLYTQTQLNHYDNQWNGAVALAKHLRAAKTYSPKSGPDKGKTLPVTRDVVYSALLKEYKSDPEFAAAAANMIFGQSVDQHDLHVLATKGVHPVNPLANTVVGGTQRIVRALKGK